MNDQVKDKIYLNLVPNLNKKQGDNLPTFVAPNNPKAPEGKNWKINANIGGVWYDYAAFDGIDMEGNATGGYTVVLSRKDNAKTANASQGSFKTGGFQKKSFSGARSYGNRQY